MARFCRLLLFLFLPLTAVSQQDTPSPQLQPRPAEPAKVPASGTAREIMLDVQATDKSGAPVRGLQKEDFTILDDKLPLNMVSFQAVDSTVPARSRFSRRCRQRFLPGRG